MILLDTVPFKDADRVGVSTALCVGVGSNVGVKSVVLLADALTVSDREYEPLTSGLRVAAVVFVALNVREPLEGVSLTLFVSVSETLGDDSNETVPLRDAVGDREPVLDRVKRVLVRVGGGVRVWLAVTERDVVTVSVARTTAEVVSRADTEAIRDSVLVSVRVGSTCPLVVRRCDRLAV